MMYSCPNCGMIHEAEVWSAYTVNNHKPSIMSGLSVYFCPTCQKPTSYKALITERIELERLAAK